MTSLAANNTEVPATAVKPYTVAEKRAIAAFQASLELGRYHQLYDSASGFPQIISPTDPTPAPLSWLPARFMNFCEENGHRFRSTPPSATYLAKPLKAVTGTIFLPKGPPIYSRRNSQHRRMNTYQEFQHAHPAIELSPLFLDFLRRMFPIPKELHTFCQFVGHALRFPEVRPSWHVMLPSEQGTGKGFFFRDIISPLFPHHTKLVSRFATLTGQFGGTVLETSMFTMIDDCVPGSASTQAQMKSLLSEESIYIEHKGKTGGMSDIYTRIILASNDDTPLPLEEQTRRWWIPQKLGYCEGLEGKDGQNHRQAIIKTLAEWLKLPGAMEAVHSFFMSYPLDDFDPKNVPITDSFRKMVAMSETPEQGFTADFITQHPTKVFELDEFRSKYVAKMGSIRPADAGALLRECGMVKDTLQSVHGRGRKWFPKTMTAKQAEAILDAQPQF